MRRKADSSANHSAGRVLSDSGLIPPDFWQEFNARNVGRPSTASGEAVKGEAVKEPENKRLRCS